jgi:hypothetical protein
MLYVGANATLSAPLVGDGEPEIVFKYPSGTRQVKEATYTDGVVSYQFGVGELNEAGTYSYQARLNVGGSGYYYDDIRNFQVLSPNE